jgi:hypothetical protein
MQSCSSTRNSILEMAMVAPTLISSRTNSDIMHLASTHRKLERRTDVYTKGGVEHPDTEQRYAMSTQGLPEQLQM